MEAVRVLADVDTMRDAWSIASGNYASRFAPAVAGATEIAATRLRDKLAKVTAAQLNIALEDVSFEAGRIRAKGNPDNSLSFARVAATAHWSPGTLPDGVDQTLRETVYWSPPELEAPDSRGRGQFLALPRVHLRFPAGSRSTPRPPSPRSTAT